MLDGLRNSTTIQALMTGRRNHIMRLYSSRSAPIRTSGARALGLAGMGLVGMGLVVLSLAACQSSAPSAPSPTSSVNANDYASLPAGVTPKNFQLPTGKGCSGDIARFRAVMDNDLASGHTTEKVHHDIHVELDRISRTCEPARDSEASAAVRALKSRFGYPSGE
jgi:hypothetical protein